MKNYRDRIVARALREAEAECDADIALGVSEFMNEEVRDAYIKDCVADALDKYEADCADELQYRREMGEMDDSPCLQPEDFMSFHG
jgi:hypothetical protein